MSMMDMPLPELLQYTGSTPHPNDFDAYWSRATAAVNLQGTDYRLEPADFTSKGMQCFHLWYTGVGGATIHAKFLKPSVQKDPMPAVMLFHGYQGSAADWFEMIPYACNGMAVAAMDVRGQGGCSEDNGYTKGSTHRGHIVRGIDDETPDNLFYRNVFLDCAQLARILSAMPFIDAKRLGAAGHSQGGGLTAACAALHPDLCAIALGMPFLSDYRRVSQMDYDKNKAAYNELSIYFRTRDPLHKREEQFWTRLGYIDTHNLAKYIRAETIFFATMMDDVCPPSTQFALYNSIPAKKQLEIYHEYGHEWLPMANDTTLRFLCEKLFK